MIKLTDILRENENPCWKGYRQVGMKTKNGKEVPNCVPINESDDDAVADIYDYIEGGSRGDLNLMRTGLTELPNDLDEVGGDLNISYSKVKRLPKNLKVKGRLFVGNSPIEELPMGLEADSVSGSDSNISKISQNIKINKSLYIPRSNITSLPDGLTVKGKIGVEGSGLNKVPKGLKCYHFYMDKTPLAKQFLEQDLDDDQIHRLFKKNRCKVTHITWL